MGDLCPSDSRLWSTRRIVVGQHRRRRSAEDHAGHEQKKNSSCTIGPMEQSLVVSWIRTWAFLFVLICSCRLMTLGNVEGASMHGFQRSDGDKLSEWRLLTRDNFTSELEKHEFSLCIATLPWCGESRSLMKGILRLIKGDPLSFPGLQLFFVHTNKDRLPGKLSLGGSTPSFSLFKYGSGYKYNGKRTASSIMASIRQGIPVLRTEILLQQIDSFVELEKFTDSTDKAVILFDFCGWANRLRQKHQKLSTADDIESLESRRKPDENPFRMGGIEKTDTGIGSESTCGSDGVGTSFGKVSEDLSRNGEEQQVKTEPSFQNAGQNGAHELNLDRNLLGSQKKLALERTVGDVVDTADCASQVILDPLYYLSGNTFQSTSDDTVITRKSLSGRESDVNFKGTGAEDQEYEEEPFQSQSLCSSEEYEHFEAVYHNVSRLAADSILTPDRARFAVVTDQKIVLQAGMLTQGRSWFLIYKIHDFDGLPYYFDGETDVEEFLLKHSAPLVVELEGEGYDSTPSALLNHTPSVILFIDRMSNSPEIQVKSKEALQIVQAVSYHFTFLAVSGGENRTQRKKSKDKEKRIIDLKENSSPLRREQLATPQMLGSSGLLTMLGKSTLETGRLHQGADGQIIFELVTEQHQLTSSVEGEHPILADPLIHIAKLANLKVLEEKFRQSLASGTNSFLIPMQQSGSQAQKQNYVLAVETQGLHEDYSHVTAYLEENYHKVRNYGEKEFQVEGNSVGSVLRQEDLGREHTLDAEDGTCTVENFQSETCVPRKLNLESTGIARSDTVNGMAMSSTHNKDENLPHSEEIYASTLFPNTLKKSSEPLESDLVADDKGKSGKDPEVKLTDEDLQQFVLDKDEEPLMGWNEVGFYFMDGEDHIRERLTMSKKIPALVVIDPEDEAHYIFPLNLVLNISSLISFLDSLVSGTLRRTVLSQPQLPPSREPPRPPFVNRDFHEIHSVPRVTVDSFSKLVMGYHEAYDRGKKFSVHRNGLEECPANGGNLTESAWEKDVLVLFTTPWCGFCKRMELVVREVYRSFLLAKGLESPPSQHVINSDEQQKLNHHTNTNLAWWAGGEYIGGRAACKRTNAVVNVPPVLLQMDCTLNDCSDHLGDILEEETYPAVVLFPARNKFSSVVYSGAPTVRGIFDFLKVYGTATNASQRYTGDTQSKKCSNQDMMYSVSKNIFCNSVPSSTSIKIGSVDGRRSKKEAEALLLELHLRHKDFGRRPEVGSSLLASEKLVGVSPPFENSIVLIVSSSPQGVVRGLILNKPMAWENVRGLDSRVEKLLNLASLGYGGPIVENQRPFLVLTLLERLEDFVEVLPGMYYGFVAAKGGLLDMIHTGKLAAKDFWFFLGYSSWTWDQLQSELSQDLWQLRTFTDDLVQWPPQWNI